MTWMLTLGMAEPYLNRFNEQITPDLNIWQTEFELFSNYGLGNIRAYNRKVCHDFSG